MVEAILHYRFLLMRFSNKFISCRVRGCIIQIVMRDLMRSRAARKKGGGGREIERGSASEISEASYLLWRSTQLLRRRVYD